MTRNSKQALADYQHVRRIVLALLIAAISCSLLFVGSAHGDLWHERIESVGSIIILLGIGGRLWSTLYIGGRKSAQVVDTGPYSMMRNPLYFFSGVAAVGAGAQVGSLILAFGFGLFCFIAFTVVILREEKWLTSNLGAPYLDYMARVPRFFPDPRLYRDQDEAIFKPKLLRRTLVDGLAFFAAVPVFELIEVLQEQRILPVILHVS